MDEHGYSAARTGASEIGASSFTPASSAPEPPPAPSELTTQEKKVASDPYPWILGPVIDSLFVCGGFFWLLILGLYASGFQVDLYGSPSAITLATVSILGLQLLGDAHQPATLFRVYGSKTTRDKLGIPVALIGVLAVAVGLCAFYVTSTTTILLKIILAWGIQHQLAQSYGLALVYCYKRKYYLTKNEKNVMFYMIQSCIVFMVVRMFSVKEFSAFKLNKVYDVPFWQFLPGWAATVSACVLAAMVIAFAVVVVRKYQRDKVWIPMPAVASLMSLVALGFCAGDKFLIIWYLFSTWWFHSCQYLVITTAFYLKEKGLPDGVAYHEIGKMLRKPAFFKYYALLFTTGYVVFFMMPNWLTEHGAEKAIAMAAVYIAFNLHHYITDALIWKLRDPAVQKLLIA